MSQPAEQPESTAAKVELNRNEAATKQRVLSIDALRGFDMFWIIGGSAVARAVFQNDDPTSWGSRFSTQFEHVAWEGFRFYDLIFPLFIFLVGCVLPYSLEKYISSPRKVYGRIIRRGVLLVFFGLLVNGVLQFDFANMRYAHVLQRIGIAYVFAAILYLNTTWRGQAIVATAILLGYWALLALVPAPGGVAGDYSMEGNLAGYVDRTLMPGVILEKYYGFGDNEGFLSTIPALVTGLLGLLAGTWLKSGARPWTKVFGLTLAGLVSLFVGHAWGLSFPVIKNLWTSSFVLVAGGWSLLLLAAFYAVIDVLNFHRLAFFWVVIGMNAITIYVGQRIVNFYDIAEFFVGGFAKLAGESSGLVLLVGILVVKWLLLLFMYRHRIFLRV